MPRTTFGGFPRDLFQFLGELELNNERDWFEQNKARYEASVREPALEFIRAIGPKLKRVSSHFVASDKKVGGSLMRIYRDVRFSKNKEPYKTNVGIQFRHDAGKDVHAPGLYLHIEPSECFAGVGLWRPEAEALAGIRAALVEDPTGWKRATAAKAFKQRFTQVGESLKRPPRGFDSEDPLIEDLKRKDHVATCKLTAKQLTSKTCVDDVLATFVAGKAYLKFLTTALDLAF